MATSTILLASSAKKLAPTTIVPLLQYPQQLRLSATQQSGRGLATLPFTEEETSTSRSIADTIASVYARSHIILPPQAIHKRETRGRKPGSRHSAIALASSEREVATISKEEFQYAVDSSEPPLQSAKEKMTPRQREVFEFVVSTQLSAEEIGATVRPSQPLNPVTIVAYFMDALDTRDYTWQEEEALFRAVGKERLYNIAQADPWRWNKANAFNAFVTNEMRAKALVRRDLKRDKLREKVEKGKVKEQDMPRVMQEITQGWTFADGPPTTPRGIEKHLLMRAIKNESPAFFQRNQDAAVRSKPRFMDKLASFVPKL